MEPTDANKPKNADEFIQRQQQALATNPDCGVSHYNLAVALLGQGKDDEAEKSLYAAIECSQGLVEAYALMGGIRLKRGDLEACLDWNRKAVRQRPSFSEGWGNIGFVEMQRGNVDAAITALGKATTFNHRFVQAYTTLGNAYLMKGDVAKSIENNLKALKVQADFAPAHNNLAIAYLENGENDKAVEHCRKAIELGYEVAPQIKAEIDKLASA